MPELPYPNPAEIISTDTFGRPVVDRVISRYANAAARDSASPTPGDGEMCYLQDISQIQTYDGAAWVSELGAWQDPSMHGGFLNGWGNFGAPEQECRWRHENFGKIVRLQGLVAGGTTTVNTNMFTLGAGYSPVQNFNMPGSSNNAYGQFKVMRTAEGGTVRFRAGTATNLSVECTFPIDS